MNTKERKLTIKEIREAIKCEKFQDAIEKCMGILEEDPENYMAFLLMGAAYQSIDKKIAAENLRKAVKYSTGPPTVALQGLANCSPMDELPKIYEQLLELTPDKFMTYYEKLYSISGDSSDLAAECLNIFKREVNAGLKERKNEALKYLALIWIENNFEVKAEDEPLYKLALEEVIDQDKLNVHLKANKRYLQLLYDSHELAACVKRACSIIEQYPNDTKAYEIVVRIYAENYQSEGKSAWQDELKEPAVQYAQMIVKLSGNLDYAPVVTAIDLYNNQQFVAGRDMLQKVLKNQQNNKPAVELLARIEMELGAYGPALLLWKQLGTLYTVQRAICLSYETEAEQLQEAVKILTENGKSEEAVNALARCYAKLGETEQLKDLPLGDLQKAEHVMSFDEAIKFLLASDMRESFEALLLIGKLQLQQRNYAEALTHLLKATRIRPYRAECFLYLGKVYYATDDIVRARKCFEKCVNLNPMCEEAVTALSAIYQQLGEEDLNATLLTNTLKHLKGEGNKNMLYKLGLHYLNVHKCDDAIHAFRTAIKHDLTCMEYWESLGDAYCERGSFNSAIRVFQKILEMQPSNTYSKLQIAVIKTTVRMYVEAIGDFDILLKDCPDYIPGLKGAAEAHMGLANNYKADHLYGRCKVHLQLAVNHLERAFLTLENKDVVWLWRLTASLFVQTAQMPTSMANLDVSGKLANRDTESTFLNRKDLLNLAMRFYTCALKLKQNTYLWYELALCCYYSAIYLPEEGDMYMKYAINACKMALKEQNDRWQNWNLLGVINMHSIIDDYPMAQHCFVKALTLDRKSFAAWTNLGVLYLKLFEIKLANQAFQRAQQASPVYHNAWIGQALIAEAISEYEEALDLFRHCQQFEFHPESALGYAHWVCTVLSNENLCKQPHYRHTIESMHADIIALDAINWYVSTEEDNASAAALSFQGFLNERQKLYRPALKAYQQATKKAETADERDKVFTNIGYLYLKLEQPHDAISAFNAVSQASFKAIIGLALAYFRAGQHQESYSVYNSVLKTVAESEDDKAGRILVAMASMVYASQGEADTKTILYQCILLKDSPIQALYSACALGILHRDQQLTETILTELKKYEMLPEHIEHVAYIRAQYHQKNRQTHYGLTYLISRLHMFPHCPELRKVLANYLLDYFGKDDRYSLFTFNIAFGVMKLMHHNSVKKNDCIEDSDLLLMASRALAPVNKQAALKFIQRAIHLNPRNSAAWTALSDLKR